MPQKARVTLQSINENVLEVLRKLDVTDSRVAGLQGDVSGLQSDVSGLKGDVSGLKRKLDRLEETVGRMTVLVARIPHIEARLDTIEARLSALEVRMTNLEGLYEHHDKRLEILDHEYVSITAALKRLEDRFDNLEADILRDRVRILEEKVAALEKHSLN